MFPSGIHTHSVNLISIKGRWMNHILWYWLEASITQRILILCLLADSASWGVGINPRVLTNHEQWWFTQEGPLSINTLDNWLLYLSAKIILIKYWIFFMFFAKFEMFFLLFGDLFACKPLKWKLFCQQIILKIAFPKVI